MNIRIQVLSAQARREIARVQGDITRLNAAQAAGVARGAGFGGMMAGNLKGMRSFGNQIQWTGRQLQYNWTLPILAATAAGVHFQLENERAMTRLKKVYADPGFKHTEAEVASLEKAFEALSERYGIVQSETIGIAAEWAAAGSSGIALAKQTELTMKTMVLGQLEAADATQALIAIQAQYNQSSDELGDTIARLNNVENQTGTTMGDLIVSMSRSAGVARAAGVDVSHLAAMTAALVPAAGTAAQAGNALKTIISRLLSPTGEAAQILNEMGIAIDDTAWKSANATTRIELLSDRYQGLSDSQKAVVSATLASRYQINKFEVLMEAIAQKGNAAGEGMSFYWTALKAATNRTEYLDQVTRELNTVLDSNPKKWDRIKVIMQNTLANAVQPMIPWMMAIGQQLAEWARGFADLSPVMQKWVGAILIALVVLPLLTRYIGSLITLFGVLGGILWFMLKPIVGLVAGFGRLIAALKIGTAIGWIFGAAWTALSSAFFVFSTLMPVVVKAIGLLPQVLGLALIGVLKFAAVIQGAMPAIMLAWRTLWTNMLFFVGIAMSQIPRLLLAGFGTILAAFAAVLQPVANLIIAWIPIIGAAIVRGWTWIAWTFGSIQGMFVKSVMIAWGSIAATVPGAMAIVGGLMSAVWTTIHFSLLLITETFGPMLVRAWGIIAGSLATVWGAILPAIATAWAAIGRFLFAASWAIYSGLMKAWAVILRGWALLWSAMLALVQYVIPLIIKAVAIMGRLILAALMSPWTWLVLGVAAALYALRDQITGLVTGIWEWLVDAFDAMVDRIISAFNALPQGVQNAFMAVIHFIRDAALQVYEWLSYLNPFARHSPSLVDNVQNGMRAVIDGYGQITAIKGPIDSAYASVQRFKDASGGLIGAFEAMERAKDRATIAEFAPGSLAAFDQLARNLNVMKGRQDALSAAVKRQETVVAAWKDRLDAANDALDAQRDKLDALQEVADAYRDRISDLNSEIDRLASTPITGMGAMEDQLFANEMAQKRLRLEMLKAGEQGGQTYDEIRNKLATLAGEMEMLTGRREELRGMGAGSEILSHYDQQIEALDAQRDALEDAEAPVNHLQEQLDELQRQAEIMDLEKALKFDPLTRAIDKAANSMQEMPFDSIISKIRSNQAAIDALTPRYNAATAAVDAQEQAVKRAQSAVDAIQASYDAESKKLERIRDLYQETADAVREMEGALQGASGAASGLKGAADAAKGAGEGYVSPALQNFRDAAGGNFADVSGSGMLGREGGMGDQSDLIDQFTADIAAEAGKAFDGIDMFGPLKDMWNDFYAWAKGWLTKIWNTISDFFGNLFDGVDIMGPVRDSIGGFGDEIGGLFRGIWDTIVEVVTTVWDIGGMLWDLFGPDVMTLFGTIWDFLSRLWTDLGEIFSDLGERIQPFFDAIGNIWTIVKPVVMAIIAAFLWIGEIAFEVFNGILGPVLDWVGDMFMNLWEIIRGVIDIFIGLFTLDWSRFFSGLGDVFAGLGGIIWDTITGLGEIIWDALFGLAKGLWDGFVWIGGMIWEGLEAGLRNIGLGWLVDIFGAIIDWVKDLFGINSPSTVFAEIGGWIMEGLGNGIEIAWNIVKGIFTVIFTVIKAIFEAVGAVVTWLWTNIFQPIFNLIGGIISWLWENVIQPLIPVMMEAFRIFGEVISWLWTNVASPIFSFIGDAFQVLGTIISWVWTNILQPVFEVIGEVVSWLWTNILQPIFAAIGPAFEIVGNIIAWVWNNIIKPAWDVLATVITWLWNNVLSPIFGFIGDAFEVMGDIIAWVWENIIKPAWSALETAIKWLWNNILSPIFGFIGDAFEVMGNAIEWVWDSIIEPVWDAIETAANWLWDNVLEPVFSAISTAWEALGDAFEWVYDHIIKPIFDAFESVLETLKTSFETAVDFISRVWDGLKDALMTPVQWVIDFVWNNGLRKLWNWINNLWDGDDIEPFRLASGGVVPGGGRTRQRTPGLATGGIMPGYSPGRDIHHFFSATGGQLMLSGGEAVLRPEFTRAVGSDWIDGANRAARQGGVKSVMDWMLRGGMMGGGWSAGDPASPQAFAKGGRIELPGWLDFALDWIPGGGFIEDVINSVNGGGEGGGSWGDAIWGFVKKTVGNIWDAIKDFFGFGDGDVAAGFASALGFAKTQEGKPYIWGGVGPTGYDCSGFMSALTNVIRGKAPYMRVGATANFPWDGFKAGMGPFTVGSSKDTGSGIGHMAGTLLGVNVESRGSDGVVVGPEARGAMDRLFSTRAALFDDGGLWKSGMMGMNQSGAAERVLSPRQTAAFERLVSFLDRDGVPSMARMESAIFRIEARVAAHETIGHQTVIEHQGDNNFIVNINGDLVFPNVSNGDDAKVFLRNLSDLAGRR